MSEQCTTKGCGTVVRVEGSKRSCGLICDDCLFANRDADILAGKLLGLKAAAKKLEVEASHRAQRRERLAMDCDAHYAECGALNNQISALTGGASRIRAIDPEKIAS